MWFYCPRQQVAALTELLKSNPEMSDTLNRLQEAVAADNQENTLKYREAADEIHGSDDIEIDADANISPNDEGGCWVQAWVYVLNSDAGVAPDPDLVLADEDDNGEAETV